jgi:hypothetical protein
MLAAQAALGQSGGREPDRRREAGIALMQQGQYGEATTLARGRRMPGSRL